MDERREPDVTGVGGYSIVRRIAVGGMAEVLLARQTVRPGIERLVVIKSILPGLAEHADLVTMFLSEARIAAQLQHPNVVLIHDVTRLGERPCIVMEQLVGLDTRRLGHRARERGELLPIGLVAAIGEGAALGLGYAHRARGVDGQELSVVHRDVSPHNLFVTVDGVVKVLDFGIAKSSAQLQATREGTLKGKVAYMSPEQLRGDKLDGRSDLFALGSVLWELATGQALFARGSEVESFAAVLELEVVAPSTLRPGIPEAFDRIVLQTLARDRNRRPATGEELARALHAIAEEGCDGPPALALGNAVQALLAERPPTPPLSGPPLGTLPGPGAPPPSEATEPRRAPTLTLASATVGTGEVTRPMDAPFVAGDLQLEGIDAPAEPRRSAYPERASSIPPDVRDRFDPDGEPLDAPGGSSPGLDLAVDVALDRRARGQPIPDVERRSAAVADFGPVPSMLLAPFYTLRVIRRRADLAARIKALSSKLPILEAEARDAQAAIGRAVHGAVDDRRIGGEVAAVDAATERVGATAAAASPDPRERRQVERARLDAEVGLTERLADLGKAAVDRVAAPGATGPLEAAARAAVRRLDDAQTELELCERGREMYDPTAFRNGWVLVFLAFATGLTLLAAAWMTG